MLTETKNQHSPVQPESIINILGVIYVHQKTSDGGDIYLTRFGIPFTQHLQIENWYKKGWFDKKRIRLEGTSSVYRVPTKIINGKSIDLVVKNCRVGEDVPIQTKTLLSFINAEFNSPWEEFSLVMDLREGKFGPQNTLIKTQEPLAIYVPPGKMQTWQSGRSKDKINRILARHPGIDIDILKQYKLIYGWIYGKDIVELFNFAPIDTDTLSTYLRRVTQNVIKDLESKGFSIADMKPAHIIISDNDIRSISNTDNSNHEFLKKTFADSIDELVKRGCYSVVDYELLTHTPQYENQIISTVRHTYHVNQLHRFTATEIPQHLKAVEIFDLPYIHGHVESTGGYLWVVGKNATLFDFFLPERWRKTDAWKLSSTNDVYYTVTKDHIHIVWKISRVGERPQKKDLSDVNSDVMTFGYNSPFEEFAFAHQLNTLGISTVYIRAIYMTGSTKAEISEDLSRYESHNSLTFNNGKPILCKNHNYITIKGFYNGPDNHVAQQGMPYRPLNLEQALIKGYISSALRNTLKEKVSYRCNKVGFNCSFLKDNDFLLVLKPNNELLMENDGYPEMRICNFELIKKMH